MKKLLSLLLAAVLLCGLTALPAQVESQDDLSRFSIPRILAPTIPPIEVPEIDDIKVPKVPTAAPTKKPKIEVPEIPGVDVATPEGPQVTAEVPAQVESAMAALGVTAYRALYDALSRGEAVGNGSRGDAARGLQQLLAAFGENISVDGIVGPRTLAALNAVQAGHELPQTDKLDAAGLAALLPLLLKAEDDAP